MTRAAIEDRVRELYVEAHAADPYHVDEITARVIGADVWAWSLLTTRQLQALRFGLVATVHAARGA